MQDPEGYGDHSMGEQATHRPQARARGWGGTGGLDSGCVARGPAARSAAASDGPAAGETRGPLANALRWSDG